MVKSAIDSVGSGPGKPVRRLAPGVTYVANTTRYTPDPSPVRRPPPSQGRLGATHPAGVGSGQRWFRFGAGCGSDYLLPRMTADGSDQELTHIDAATGEARMVDVGAKPVTARVAEARGLVRLDADVRRKLFRGELPKGEGLGVARIAGIQAAKATDRLIPLCHSVPLDSVDVQFEAVGADCVEIRATARCTARTGVEMEALTAVSVAALTVYDMCKALCRGAEIESIRLEAKSGGRSGAWRRADAPSDRQSGPA